MPEKVYSSIFGAGSTGIGILSGIINVASIAEALVLGFAGAAGGLLAHGIWKWIQKKFFKK
jgi:hypothetical protein